ncbi:MAG: hypothetical protein JNM93_11305 [Bacteriovoracaceae bacterium]|nr:hypothetical protein [Bacteriovoracaceae bacterium]
MENIISSSLLDNQSFILVCMLLAVFRVYLEVINFRFEELPITKMLGAKAMEFHRLGLYFSLGYILFFAPSVLMN